MERVDRPLLSGGGGYGAASPFAGPHVAGPRAAGWSPLRPQAGPALPTVACAFVGVGAGGHRLARRHCGGVKMLELLEGGRVDVGGQERL